MQLLSQDFNDIISNFVTMIYAGYFAALLIGVSLSLIGGGGSILTVPVLVYLLGADPVQATAYSLLIVGVSSAVGVWPKFRQGHVDLRTAVVFGVPSIIAVFMVRALVVPAIPEVLFSVAGRPFTRSALLMFLFAGLILAASVSMIRDGRPKREERNASRNFNYPPILAEGLVVGSLTGLVGSGGGFLIIPALVLFSGLSMKKAVGTSLLIIATKSLIGFTGDLAVQAVHIDWKLLFIVSALAVAGILIGNFFSKKIPGEHLKKGFGWFALVMGVFVIITEVSSF